MKTILLTLTLSLAAPPLFAENTTNFPAPSVVAGSSTNRPATWAQPFSVPGISNMFMISTNLYRGAQPSAEGMKNLKAMGIKTVINLRTLHSDKDEAAGTGLKTFRFTTQPWRSEDEDVVNFLKVVTDTNNFPVYFHCQRGADRTGMMCAMYRITVCGWTKKQAIDEMKNGDYNFAAIWKNIVKYIEKVDIAKIKRKVGIAEKPVPPK